MQYVLLLRGINVGGKNRVSMAALKEQLSRLGYRGVQSYINSGNLIFCSDDTPDTIRQELANMLAAHYPFPISLALIPGMDYIRDAGTLPDWWDDDRIARKDVLFYTGEADKTDTRQRIEAMKLGNEKIHFGEIAVYWGKCSMADYSGTAYAKYVLEQPFYKQVTIRNANTHRKLLMLLQKDAG